MTVSISLSCRLDVFHPHETAEELYTAQFYWSRDVGSPPGPSRVVGQTIVNVDVPRQFGEPFTVDLGAVSDDPHLPRTLNVRLYTTGVFDGLAIVQLCMGSSFLPTTSLANPDANVTFVDSTNVRQAQMTITWPKPDVARLALIPADFHDAHDQKHTQELISLCKSQYAQGMFIYSKKRHVFYSVSTDNGHLPIVCFPLLATLSSPLFGHNIQFLVHSVEVACRLRRVDIHQLSSLSAVELMEVVNETLSLVTKCLMYTSDRTRSKTTTTLFYEQWERCSLFPHRSLAGYDCEDSAQLIQEVAHPLRTSKLLPPLLAPINRLLSRMTVFTGEGDLRTGSTWTPHCYVLLLDSQYVDYLRGFSSRATYFLPSLVVEGTGWDQGVWDPSAKELYGGGKTLKSLVKSLGIHSDLVKMYSPVLRGQEKYGLVAQLQTADHHGEMLTLALVRSGTMGVPLEDLMLHRAHRNDVQVWTKTSAVERVKIEQELLELPLSSLPSWDATTTESTTPPQGQEAMVMRWIDYEELGVGLFPDHVSVQRVDVTRDGCSFALITL